MKSTKICLEAAGLTVLLFLFASSIVLAQTGKQSAMNKNVLPAPTLSGPVDLRCEYLVTPLGIDEPRPRLSWIVEDPSHTRGQRQMAYQILVASSEKKLKADEGDLWKSGRVESSQQNQIEYNGRPLTSRMRCYWKVRTWDKDEAVSQWSKPAFWSMGLLQAADWKAKWIGTKPIVLTGDPQQDSIARLMTPSPLLRKTFQSDKRISRATLYVTALGLYEVKLNGRRVGDHELAPEWTDYRDRVQYQTYDVTALLAKGANVLSATLADGWYVGAIGSFGDLVANRGRSYASLDRKFLAQLEIETADGQLVQVVSDEGWRVNPDGPIRSADIYLGEIYDARKLPKGWEEPGFDESKWEQATVYPATSAALVAQMNEPVMITRELRALAIRQPSEGTYIFDMGQNMVGWCAVKIDEPDGRKVTIRHGEMLTDEGKLYTDNLRRATATDEFISDGKGAQIFEPRFTYHGFRYMEVTGLSKRPTLDMVLGKEVASRVAPAGSFECSNKDLNQLWKNIRWTQWDNLIGIPTDCPQRDERLGWMADAQVFSQTAIDNCDMAAFYTKWTQDIRDAQREDGAYPDVAPVPSILPFYNAPGWADAGVIVPWRLYQNYGDTRVLRKHYESAKRFIDFVHSKNPNLIWTEAVGNMYGDWLNGNTIVAEGYPKTGGQVPYCIFNTMNFAHSTQILSDMARVLGYTDEAATYARLAADIRSALQKAFVDKDGFITDNTQAGYALSLGYGLLPEAQQKKALEHMLSCLADYDFRISTGFLSTIQFMQELARWGYPEMAYQLIESHRFPSWLYQIDQGATTIWERWDGYVKGRGFQDPGMNSFNHYAIGSVGEWMYSNILGIQRAPGQPGYQHFVIHPQIGGTLTWANGAYRSMWGDIVSAWKLHEGLLNLHVEVPANTSAIVYVPTRDRNTIKEGDVLAERSTGVKFLRMEGEAAVFEVVSGEYDFSSEYAKQALKPYAAKPGISYERKLDASGNLKVSILAPESGATIHYSLDGSEPTTPYEGPFLIDRNTVVSARTEKEGLQSSFPALACFAFTDESQCSMEFPGLVRVHKGFGKSVQYTHPYAQRRPGRGEAGLVNGKFASLDFVDPEWQGFEGVDFAVVIDLEEPTMVKLLAANFLNQQSREVFLPTSVEFSTSENGKDYESVSTIENGLKQETGASIKTFKREFQPRSARYVKIVARNIGKCPDWHPMKGRNAWLGVDEVVIE
jgi:alpha-L-rhamnosidase